MGGGHGELAVALGKMCRVATLGNNRQPTEPVWWRALVPQGAQWLSEWGKGWHIIMATVMLLQFDMSDWKKVIKK